MQNVDQANSQEELDLVDFGEDFEIVDVAINPEDDIAIEDSSFVAVSQS